MTHILAVDAAVPGELTRYLARARIVDGEQRRASHMNVEKLARMADQIAANIDYGSNQPRAVVDIADHLLRFWTREMRVELSQAHARHAVELSATAALALDVAMRPGAAPQVTGTGGDAG